MRNPQFDAVVDQPFRFLKSPGLAVGGSRPGGEGGLVANRSAKTRVSEDPDQNHDDNESHPINPARLRVEPATAKQHGKHVNDPKPV